jgi:TolB-like protein/Flp pilus assembly protein TadD
MADGFYRFLDFELDPATRELRRAGLAVAVEPKAFDLLLCLLENRQRTLSKDELLELLWPRIVVAETSLTRCVMKARKAVGDDSDRQAVIKTIQRRGYRFVAVVSNDEPAAAVENPSRPDKPSLVVLPFANAGGDEDTGFLADGLTEDVIIDLSRNGWLFVIARNSSFSYKGQTVPSQQVAAELGVRYLVEGSVRRAGNRLRVAAQLVDADTGTQEWSERYDRPVTDLFAVQDEISQGIVASLGSELRRAEGRRARSTDPNALDAWGLVHRGMAISWSTFNKASNLAAEALYRRAVAVAPEDPRAHAFLANCLAMKVVNGWSDDVEADHGEAWRQVREALDIAPDDPIVLGQVGHAHTCLQEPDTAVRLLKRSIELDPNGAFSIGVSAYALTAVGRAEEAVAAANEVMRRSPRDPSAHWNLVMGAWAYLQLEQFDVCAARCQASIDHYDGWQPPWITLGVARAELGDVAGAVMAIKQGRRLARDIPLSGYQDFFRFMSRDVAQGDRVAEVLAGIWVTAEAS